MSALVPKAGLLLHDGGQGDEILLVCIAARPHRAYQPPGLDGALRRVKLSGDLILGRASRLDAFSGYRFRS